MTDQMSDSLANECPDLELSGLYLYGIIRGSDPCVGNGWGDEFVRTKAWQDLQDSGVLETARFRFTALHSGVICRYRISRSGGLRLAEISVLSGFVEEVPEVALPGTELNSQFRAEGILDRESDISIHSDGVWYHLLRHQGVLYLVDANPLDQVDLRKARNDRMEFVDYPADEEITGDFWLVLKPSFRASRTYVPFINGRVVTDQSRWVKEPEKGPSGRTGFLARLTAWRIRVAATVEGLLRR
ncbi:hypothetical protein HBA55_36480 [Pseudomaricurvus alkylphenolicus]|uniref:hypothetical protein n=1 Tax=Pseudomaricurvus alkylphenolicus TaxID=1306991 RepID=UPI001420D875|nr:hypothetical protein [Pseudomaricurvus alkylphenolicus]NIB45133.1 hypothetical protein [Pseudomaricurvus alkylphenolicus]